MILGIDEAGRGPWAGPLVVGAVVFGEQKIEGLNDSKKLSARRREELNELILATAHTGLGWVSAMELDEIGLSAALRLATRRAVEQIRHPYSEIIIDGKVNFLAGTGKGAFTTTLVKADLLIPEVSAASIIAKVARDRYMCELAKKYPNYAFESHMGYGTGRHRQALAEHGICREHRRSFAPIAKMLGAEDLKIARVETRNTTELGHLAENKIADYLKNRGHKILARNWRTTRCEIDIVSCLDEVLYFTEVKYRRNTWHGDGLEAIGSKKLSAMQFAAKIYLAKLRERKSKLAGMGRKECVPSLAKLQVAALSGEDFKIDAIFELD